MFNSGKQIVSFDRFAWWFVSLNLFMLGFMTHFILHYLGVI